MLFQQQVGYTSLITLTDQKAFTYKKYVDDLFAGEANYVPLAGTILGKSLTGPIVCEPSSVNTIFVSTISDGYFGFGNNIDLSSATLGSFIYGNNSVGDLLLSSYGSSYQSTIELIGTSRNSSIISQVSNNSGSTKTILSQNTTDIIFSGTSSFSGFTYDGPAAGYVSINGTGNTMFHRDYNDLRYAPISSSGYLQLIGTITGHPLTGQILYNPSVGFSSAFVSTTQSYLIGAGDTADLSNTATKQSSIYFIPNGTLTQIRTTDGTNLGLVTVHGNNQGVQIYAADGGSNNTTFSILNSSAQIISNASAFVGLTYDSSTSNYASTNATNYSIMHRSYNDTRYAASVAGGYLPLSGAVSMTGTYNLYADASSAMQPVTYQQLTAAITGVFKIQGGYDISITGNYPIAANTTNPVSITIKQGMIWLATNASPYTIGSITISKGDEIVSLIDNPLLATDWNVISHDIGYVPLSNVLTASYIYVGSSGNIATGVALTQDASVSNTGVWTNTGIQGKGITLDTGLLKYNGTAWVFDNSTYLTSLSGALLANGSVELTADWAVGSFNITGVKSLAISGTGGNGYITLVAQSSNPAAPSGGTTLFSNSNNKLSWRGSANNFVKTFDGSAATADRVYSLPDAAGTVTIIDASQTISNKTLDNTNTIQTDILTVTYNANPTWTSKVGRIFAMTGMSGDITSMTTNMTNIANNGDMIMWQFTDNGTFRNITWGANFGSTPAWALPTKTTVSTLLRVLLQYNGTNSLWECITVD